MKFSKSKWFAYTLVVGLIPMLTRLLVWATTDGIQVEPVAAMDLIALGLVLHTSTINEISRLPARECEWKVMQTGLAILLIAIYGALYALAIIGDKVEGVIDDAAVLTSSFIIAGVSTFVSIMLLHRLTQ